MTNEQISQKMYNTDNFESDLINSYAWDTAMVFIQKFSGDKAYSMQSSAYDKVVGCGEIHSEGKSDVKCNIYDMAGNTREWSTETSSHLEYQYPCVGRGGTWQGDYAGLRYSLATNVSSGDISARPVLYL